MFNWFQQAKELVSPPSIQMGQPVPANSEATNNSAKKKKVDDEGEMTEEGFVCVGRSSFYSIEQPAVPQSYNSYNLARATPYPPSPFQNHQFQGVSQHQQMYPQLPTPMLNHDYHKNAESSSLEQVNEFIRHVPFVLNPALRPHASYNPISPHQSTNRKIDWSLYDYDFDFELSVIREVNQFYSDAR